MTLHDIAPRLARARDERRYELAVIDGPGWDVGDDYAELLSIHRAPYRCGNCQAGGTKEVVTQRLLVGVNRGEVVGGTWFTCRHCGAGRMSSRSGAF